MADTLINIQPYYLVMGNIKTEGLCRCKIGRAMRKYDLDRLNTDIVEYRDTENKSLRDLEKYINKRILRKKIENTPNVDMDTDTQIFGAISDGDAINHIYEVLHDDSTPPDHRARVEKQLEQVGVDVEAIRSDWITHTTVSSHLSDCLDIDTNRSKPISQDQARKTIEWAKTKCKRIISRTVTRLQANNKITIANPDVSISVHITCTDCHQTFSPEELMQSGTCKCINRQDSPDYKIEERA